ncbi:RNB domain-containing ribonuclease, partial [Klebsiella pneumoniae]|uniref:RNB domain-containing ribonuclease n=1 Tax=Klebsiella pneumoniae TaxID=573 RepID=UPI0030D76E3F
ARQLQSQLSQHGTEGGNRFGGWLIMDTEQRWLLRLLNEARGGISFESEEAKFIFNAERRIERIEQTQRNDAHKLIEECMIL